MRDVLEARTCSGFGISIGTGNALRALFIPTAEVYKEDSEITPIEKVDVKQFSVFAVSWYTIIRNILSAVDKNMKEKILKGRGASDVIAVAMNEIEVIHALSVSEGLTFKLLFPSYRYVFGAYPIVEDGKNDAIRVFRYAQQLKPMMDFDNNHNFALSSNGLLLSHINFDLLNSKSKGMKVLESHTGKILEKKAFTKKYRQKDTYTFLPFCPELLYLLGDKSGLIKLLLKPSLRHKVVSVLSQAKISPNDNCSRIKTILMRDNDIGDYIRGFSNPY